MRGLRLLLVPVAASAGVFIGPAAHAQDRDCADFQFQEDAQAFFEANRPGDPHNLDSDNDGIACETLRHKSATQAAGPAAPRSPQSPRSPRTPGTPRTPRTPRTSIPANDKDCSDFRTQAEAQAFFRAQGAGDPHRLDPDGDGIACQNLPGKASLPETGTDTRRFGLMGLGLLGAGVLLVTVTRRRLVTRPSAPWGDDPLIGW